MNKKWIISLVVIAVIVVALLVWLRPEKTSPLPPVVVAPPLSTPPAREIPAQVTQNMQQALAEREKKLQALQATSDTKHKEK